MEIRARYLQMGVFILVVLFAGIAFAYWLNHAGALRDGVRFEGSSASGAYASMGDAQWSDARPKLVQMTLLRSLGDAGRFSGVSRPLEGQTSDVQLLLDMRKFQISPNRSAEVEIGCKLVGGTGRIMATRTFRASAPIEGQGAPAAVAALDKAFGRVGGELTWTTQAAAAVEPSVGPKRTSGG